MKVPAKTNVRRVYPFADKNTKPNTKNSNRNIDIITYSKMPISAELLKIIVFGAFLFAVFCALIINFAGTYISLSQYYNSSIYITILKTVMILSISTYVSYGAFLVRKTKIYFILFLVLSYISLVLSMLLFLYTHIELWEYILIIISSNILGVVFSEIGREIISEKDKNYVINYFSALTAFVALIVSLVGFFK